MYRLWQQLRISSFSLMTHKCWIIRKPIYADPDLAQQTQLNIAHPHSTILISPSLRHFRFHNLLSLHILDYPSNTRNSLRMDLFLKISFFFLSFWPICAQHITSSLAFFGGHANTCVMYLGHPCVHFTTCSIQKQRVYTTSVTETTK